MSRTALNALPVSRRRVLSGLAASVAVAAPVATGALPMAADAQPAEHPWQLARRLADQLSDVLDRIDGGAWRAEILPSSAERYAIGFFRRDATSALDDLIAEHDALDAKWTRLIEIEGDLEEATPLQPERVLLGIRKWWKADGSSIEDPLFAASRSEIVRQCSLDGGIPIDGVREMMDARRDQLLAELSAIKQANAEAREASGLAAAEHASRAIGKQVDAARDRVYAYRPQSVEEFRTKEVFVARQMEFTLPTEKELMLIFDVERIEAESKAA